MRLTGSDSREKRIRRSNGTDSKLSITLPAYVRNILTLIVLGEGQFSPCDAKFSKKCPSSHNNNTALIKQQIIQINKKIL